MELIQVGEKTYYIPHRTNIGVYKTAEDRVCLIDTGSKGDGETIDELISGKGWSIDYIINTHTHIDHLGGNRYLMEKYHIPAYCTEYELVFAHYGELEAAYMNGGYPCRALRKVFAHPGKIGFRTIEEADLPGIQWKPLPGHTFGMIGIKTEDDVWFLGDAYLSREFLKHYSFGYLCNVEAYLNTLDALKTLDGKLFIAAHGTADQDIGALMTLNEQNIGKMTAMVRQICREAAGLDEILQKVYALLGMRTTLPQHALLSSTMKSYLTYLQDREELTCQFIDGKLIWKTV